MAFSRPFAASLLVSLLLLHLSDVNQMMAVNAAKSDNPSPSPCPSPSPSSSPSTTKIDCSAACSGRCKETKRPNLCKRACGSCCDQCNCVPPGTYGNYEACPCYYNLRTHNLIRKCP